MSDSLADQIRAQAAISARPGQLVALEALAAQVAELEHERDMLRQMLRAAAVQLAPAQRPLLGYAVVDARRQARNTGPTLLGVWPDVAGPLEAWGAVDGCTVVELREVQA